MKSIEEIRVAIENEKARSAWEKGVKLYAFELLYNLQEAISGGYVYPQSIDTPAALER